MITKYGNEINIEEFCDRLVGRIFKILPLLEEQESVNVDKYLDSLLIELNGAVNMFSNNNYFVSIVFSLEGIKQVKDYNVCRRKIFECINLVNKLKEEVREK